MNRLKRFLQTALTYFIGNILSKLITFVLIPIYTNKLTPSEYGNYDLVITIITLLFLLPFFKFGMVCFDFRLNARKIMKSMTLYVIHYISI